MFEITAEDIALLNDEDLRSLLDARSRGRNEFGGKPNGRTGKRHGHGIKHAAGVSYTCYTRGDASQPYAANSSADDWPRLPRRSPGGTKRHPNARRSIWS